MEKVDELPLQGMLLGARLFLFSLAKRGYVGVMDIEGLDYMILFCVY